MRSGRLRDLITFQRQAVTQDTYGQRVETWADPNGQAVRGAVEPIRGVEYISASAERAEVSTRIRVRYGSLTDWVRPRDRAVVGGIVYDIHSVIDTDNRHRELQLMCEVLIDD